MRLMKLAKERFIYVRDHMSREKTNKALLLQSLPYQVNKARLIGKIAELVKEKKIDGITGLRDESDKDGMRMVVELRRGEVPEVMLNNLYKLTEMQTVFGINMVAIDHGMPKLMNLKSDFRAPLLLIEERWSPGVLSLNSIRQKIGLIYWRVCRLLFSILMTSY